MRRLAIPAVVLAAVLAACAEQEKAHRCEDASGCPADSRCRGGVCVANAPPVARISAPTSPLAFALVTLSGTSSFDPDPEDGIASYRWTIRPAGAGCPPPAVAGTEATAAVRFGCPGAHEVELVVLDGLGRESEPEVVPVDVAPDPGPPLVTAGSDVSLGHTCSGTPLLCRADAPGGAIALSSTGPVDAGISYFWIVQPPPGRPPAVGRRVIFDPGPDVPDPSVVIETDGLAISGDWIFRVEARDAAGAVGAAAMRVSIGNRPPVVAHASGPVPHSYDPVQQAFHATGEVGVDVFDPDGDPIASRRVAAHHAGDGPLSTFVANDVGERITFSITVPYDDPEAPALLIGGAGLERSISFSARDANGEETIETWDVAVENEPPVLAAPALPVAVDHAFAGNAYVAAAALTTWTDPDGDPLTMVARPPVGPCAPPTLTAGTASVTCTVPFAGSAVADLLVGNWPIAQAVSDPWASSATAVTTLTILNRPPAFLVTSFLAQGTCTEGLVCCDFDLETHTCLKHESVWHPGTDASSGAFLGDADGDPLSVVFAPGEFDATPGSSVCTPSACAFAFRPAGGNSIGCYTIPSATAEATITDGVAAVSSALQVVRSCDLPPGLSLPLEHRVGGLHE